MYCSKCGYKNAENSKFCNSCGQPVAGSNMPQPSQHRKPMTQAMIGACIIGGFGVIGFLYSIFTVLNGYEEWGRYYKPSELLEFVLYTSILLSLISFVLFTVEGIKQKRSQNQSVSSGYGETGEKWNCLDCKQVNPPTRNSCINCNAPKSAFKYGNDVSRGASNSSNIWRCSDCQTANHKGDLRCKVCGKYK